MAELPQVVPGEPVQSTTFGNPVIDRVISRYVDATARDFAVPLPQPGDPAYLTSTDELQIYNGSAWVTYGTAASVDLKVAKAGDTMTGRLVIEALINAVTQGQVEIDGKGGVPRMIVRRDSTPIWWRLAQNSGGPFVIQVSSDGGQTWDTSIQLNPDTFDLEVGRVVTPTVGDVTQAQVVVGEGGLYGTGSLVGLVSTEFSGTRWVMQIQGGTFSIANAANLSSALLALTGSVFSVPIVDSTTTAAAPNMNVASGGSIRRSTAVMALQADLEALELQVATLQATVDAL